MRTDQPPQLSVLLEHETGVMEVFLAMRQNDDHTAFYPVSSVPRAGTIKSTDREQLVEALSLLKWSQDHVDVFEGRVCS